MNKKLFNPNACVVCGLDIDPSPYGPHPYEGMVQEYNICPCCGFGYGVDDDGGSNAVVPEYLTDIPWDYGDEQHVKIISYYRKHWIESGMKWKHDFSEDSAFPENNKPQNWSPLEQLKNVPDEFLDDWARGFIKLNSTS